MTVHIVTIGDELLIGQVIDTNSARIAKYLQKIGGNVTGRTTVGDRREDMLEAFETASKKADVILVTGGLGPTEDDLTTKVLAEFYGTGFVFHQPTLEHINRLYERFGRDVPDAVRNQCWLPQNATILQNKMGSAPGMWFDEDDKVLVSMPGVPYEMEYLMENEVIPRLKQRFKADHFAHRTILTVGEGESSISEMLSDFERNLPPAIKLAYLPGVHRVRLRLTATGNDEAMIRRLLEKTAAELESLLPPQLVAGHEEDTLEIALGRLLKERGLTLSTAESCTGGYVAHLITNVPGASAYYQGSVVSYSNEVKTRLLEVGTPTLENYGAVSEQTVREMVAGSLKLLNTDIALATSGIAGPDGGTEEKPVGTVWLAVGNKNRIETKKLQLGKDRLRNIMYSATAVLNMVRLFVLEEENKKSPAHIKRMT